MPILANNRLCMQKFRPKTSCDTEKNVRKFGTTCFGAFIVYDIVFASMLVTNT